MKLLMIITRGDEFGGAQVHVRELCRGLVAAGVHVEVVAGSSGVLTESLDELGVVSHTCPALLREIHPLRDIRAVRDVRRIIRAVDPDLVCTHSTKAGIIGRVAARLCGVPCVFTAHGWAFVPAVPQPQRSIYRALERLAAPLAARIICVSNADRAAGIAAGIGQGRLVTIHNGLPDLTIPTSAGQEGESKPVRILKVARFAVPKDHATVIRAMVGIPNAVLDLVGDGPTLPAARALVHELDLTDRVTFLGARNDVAELLARADIFVLSSDREGFPLSTLEAMRAALPVVVSNVGGAPEAVTDGRTGLLVTARDVEGFRRALAQLVDDPALRVEMGLQGRERFASEYAVMRMLERTLAVYAEVLAEKRRTVLRMKVGGTIVSEPAPSVAVPAKDSSGGR